MTSCAQTFARWHRNMAALLCVTMAVLPPVAKAQTNTFGVLSNTIQAVPSCLSYNVRGSCFWLKCSFIFCSFNVTLRVRHYLPDVIVSTYNDVGHHPWADIGKPLATTLDAVGGVILGATFDASANTARPERERTSFKSVDVIGNPVGMLATWISGNGSTTTPKTFTIPGFSELQAFPGSELPRIGQLWQQVPVQTGNNLAETARAIAAAPQNLVSQAMGLPGKAANLPTSLGKVGSVMGKANNANRLGATSTNIRGLDTGPLKLVGQMINAASAAAGSQALICPGSATAFGLHYFSDLDAPFWRGFIPLESLYPGAWVPGIEEISQGNALAHTWGNLYPRQGDLTQVNPVKMSAVVASRAVSIIKASAQPHIYSRLNVNSNGVRYFETQGDPQFQEVYPKRTGCMRFGADDSTSASSFGDGESSTEQGYIWNVWHRYDCCGVGGNIYLGSFTL
jgi:integrating conjugative element protein (TIGR03756 family)